MSDKAGLLPLGIEKVDGTVAHAVSPQMFMLRLCEGRHLTLHRNAAGLDVVEAFHQMHITLTVEGHGIVLVAGHEFYLERQLLFLNNSTALGIKQRHT